MDGGGDFLSDQNIAGQSILRLTSRGNAILAELLRLGDHVPPAFLRAAASAAGDAESSGKKAAHKKGAKPPTVDEMSKSDLLDLLLVDFRYLRQQEFYEHRIESNPRLAELDEEFKDEHLELLKRFYQLFQSILKYVQDLKQYIEDLNEGVFIQHQVEVRAWILPSFIIFIIFIILYFIFTFIHSFIYSLFILFTMNFYQFLVLSSFLPMFF
jgi:WASH complex subunit strumpellin